MRALIEGRAGPVAQWLEPTAHNGLVGGSSPPGPTSLSNRLAVERTRAPRRCQRYCQRLRPAVAQRVRGATQVFGMVMTINAIKYLDRHAEKAGRLPLVDAVLHQPGRRGVAQGVRADASAH